MLRRCAVSRVWRHAALPLRACAAQSRFCTLPPTETETPKHVAHHPKVQVDEKARKLPHRLEPDDDDVAVPPPPPVLEPKAPTVPTEAETPKAAPDTRPAAVDDDPPKVSIPAAVMWMLPHLWPKGRWDHRARVTCALGMVFAAKGFSVAVPFYFKAIVDSLVVATGAASATATATAAVETTWMVGFTTSVATSAFGPGVFAFVAAYGISRLLASFSSEARTAAFARVSADAYTNINESVFLKLHAMDLNFHLSRKTGSVTRVLDRGSRAFSSMAWCMMFVVVPTAFEMTLVCGLLHAQVGWEFVCIAAAAVGVYVAWTTVITNWRSKFRDSFNAKETKTSAMVVDSLLNFETVKYFGTERYEARRLRAANEDMNTYVVRLEQSMSGLNFGQQAIFILAATSSFYFASTGVLAGTMTVGDLVLVDSLLLQLYTPLSWLGIVYRELLTSTQNMQAMLGLMNADIKIRDKEGAQPLRLEDGTIEFVDARFAYTPHRRVLNDVRLTIPGGSHVGFVGPSGTGKTTIFRLLFRFFDLEAGSIRIDGQDISTVQIESLRRHIGVIPQDTVMFNDTVRFNIEYGRLGASEEEVIAAAKAAHIHDAILALPEGYDTVVGERGLKLSGGEKQRLAIARVLLKDAPIVLADEATSALDTATEANVVRTLRESASGKRTVVMIAHRLATVRNCDIIFVLNTEGLLEESGSHDELLLHNGLYAKLWHEQQNSSSSV